MRCKVGFFNPLDPPILGDRRNAEGLCPSARPILCHSRGSGNPEREATRVPASHGPNAVLELLSIPLIPQSPGILRGSEGHPQTPGPPQADHSRGSGNPEREATPVPTSHGPNAVLGLLSIPFIPQSSGILRGSEGHPQTPGKGLCLSARPILCHSRGSGNPGVVAGFRPVPTRTHF